MNTENEQDGRKRRPIIELPAEEAKAFFLKHESYFTTRIPEYIEFDGLLSNVAKLSQVDLCAACKTQSKILVRSTSTTAL